MPNDRRFHLEDLRRIAALCLVAVLLSNCHGASDAQKPADTPATSPGFLLEDLRWLRPLPTGNLLFGLVGMAGDYVAVGQAGTVYTSKYGLVDSGTLLNLHSVAFGEGTFVAVGAFGTILTSSTGADWTPRSEPAEASHLSGVAFGAGAFVAVGSGDVSTSRDAGVTWTKRRILDTTTTSFTKVFFENGQFLALTDASKLFTSPDGTAWTERGLPGRFEAVRFAQGRYVAVDFKGWVYTSADGASWSFIAAVGVGPDDIYGLEYEGGLFIAVGGHQFESGSVYTSVDAIHWTRQDVSLLFALFRVVFTGTEFVAVGEAGLIVESSDGVTWKESSARLGKRGLGSIAWGNDRIIATMSYYTEHALHSSADGGDTWTVLPSLPGDANVQRIKFMDGLFYAFCRSTILTSPDAVSWTQFASSSNPSTSLEDVIHVNGLYVMVGSFPSMQTSSDGIVWTARSAGPNDYGLNRTLYANGTFVAVGNLGKILHSNDGLTWGDATILADDDFVDVAVGRGQFVALGRHGTVYSSSTGDSWTNRVRGVFTFMSQLLPTDDGFVAAGGFDHLPLVYARLYTSIDGIHWAGELLPFAGSLTGVARSPSGYLLSGSSGVILQAGKATSYPALPVLE
jgi:hypothetical protein